MSCGLHGRVVTLGEKVVTVEVAPKIQMQFDRTAIQSIENIAVGEAKEREK
jgi:preprotein translocase subunit YajC